jgi:ribosomal protein S11
MFGRALRILPLALALPLCACDNPVDSAGQLKAGLTGLGSAVQNSAPTATNAASSAASALSSLGETTLSATDTAKDALTGVGESVQTGAQAVTGALTSVGQTVLDVTSDTPAPTGK